MKTYGREELQLHAPAALPPSPSWTGGWVGHRTGLDTVSETIQAAAGNQNLVISPVAYTDWATAVPQTNQEFLNTKVRGKVVTDLPRIQKFLQSWT
jgi:hypothetical protein